MIAALLSLGVLLSVSDAHTPGAYLTWNREISRVFYARCASCHREDGTSFSLMTYSEVQPRLVQIREQVLGRKMPPWGAVKGFGDFRNDAGLTQEEIELIADWIDSDAPRGNNPGALPPLPRFKKPSGFSLPREALRVSGDLALTRPFILDGLYPEKVGGNGTARIVARFPDGRIEPLLWLYEYQDAFAHPFLLRAPIELPKGSVIHGIPSGAQMVLLPGKKAAPKPK
ncbi:MAG TPA: cytochrome c [Terriglobia bacterium]|nr:cytochrome c [Terriglobia bacterium]